MINSENLEKLYNEIITNGEISTKTLTSFKFNSVDLSTLQKNNQIVRTRWGHYTIKDVNILYNYGLNLLSERKFKEAFDCFKRCYELDPNHKDACLQLLLRSIRSGNYTDVIKYYETLSNCSDEYYRINADYYLYLLNILTDLPDNYREYARHIDIKQITLPKSTNVENPTLENSIRDAVLRQKYTYALKEMNSFVKNKNANIHDYIVLALLNNICDLENNKKQEVIDAAQNKDYDYIIDYLEEKDKKAKLTTNEAYILKLTKALIEITKTRKIPIINSEITNNLYIAIDNHNYPVAMSLSHDYNKRCNIKDDNNAINILLRNICELIKDIKFNHKGTNVEENANGTEKTNNNQLEKVTIDTPQLPVESNLDNSQPNISEDSIDNIDSNITIAKIISSFIKNDFDTAITSLKLFLKNINMDKYESLIINLIKISFYEEDLILTKPTEALKSIENSIFNFELGYYIRLFYTALSENKLEIAKLYLNIIETYNELNDKTIITTGMHQVLLSVENALNYQYNNVIIKPIDDVITKCKSK